MFVTRRTEPLNLQTHEDEIMAEADMMCAGKFNTCIWAMICKMDSWIEGQACSISKETVKYCYSHNQHNPWPSLPCFKKLLLLEARWKNLQNSKNVETIHEAEGLENDQQSSGMLILFVALRFHYNITDDLTNDIGKLGKFAKIPEILDNPEVSRERRANLVFRYSGDP